MALAAADKAAVEVDGRFVAAKHVPDYTNDRSVYVAGFKSHGLEWRLVLEPNGDDDSDGNPRVGLRLLGGFPKQVRRVTSLIDLATKEPTIKMPKPNNRPTTRRSRLVSNRSKVRYQAGLIKLRGAPLLELDDQDLLMADDAYWTSACNDLTPAGFRDPAAGWVTRNLAAPFVRILEVRDPTPAELAAAEAD